MFFVRSLGLIALTLLLLSGCTKASPVVTVPTPANSPSPSIAPSIQKVLDDFDRATLEAKNAKEAIDREAEKTKGCIAKKEMAAYPNQPPLTADCKQRLAALNASKKSVQKP